MRKEMLENMRAWNPLYEDDDDSSNAADADDDGFFKMPDMDLSGGFDWSKMKDSFDARANAAGANVASASSVSSGGKGQSTSCVTVNAKTVCETSTDDGKDGEGNTHYEASASMSSETVNGKGKGKACVTVNGKTKCETYTTDEDEPPKAVGKSESAEKVATS